MKRESRRASPSVKLLLQREGTSDPETTIVKCAQRLISEFSSQLPAKPPIDMELLASFCGITVSDSPPAASDDSELLPVRGGSAFEIRLNRSRPMVRQRFSIAHEIAHTFFPDCAERNRYRLHSGRWQFDPNDHVEYLCDLAASHLVLPSPWFDRRVKEGTITAKIVLSACKTFQTSKEATLIRTVRSSTTSAAVVFLAVKLKPTQERALSGSDLFPEDVKRTRKSAETLRVQYSIRSKRFVGFLKPNKSVKQDSLIWKAAESDKPQEGTELVEFGSWSQPCRVVALPLLLLGDAKDGLGTNRVAAWIEPPNSSETPTRQKKGESA